jgi:ketosteroid isomerase-like protein
MLNAKFAAEFASQWISNWNARGIEQMLSHFRDDCEFESPFAATLMGSARLHGKEALRKYWQAALAQLQSLQFVLEDHFWDQDQRTLVVVYRSHTENRVTSCVELMQFDPDGKQIYGRAYYGAAHGRR